jgi:hypothetical protein
MTRKEFLEVVREAEIDPRSYWLDGGLPPERFVLSQDATGWHVYYSERGLRTGLRSFQSEGDALTYLCDELLDDPSARQPQWLK